MAQSMSGVVPVLIPAYKPGTALLTLVSDLLQRGVEAIIVVNDGSGADFDDCFRQVAAPDGVTLVHHAVNLGKGAALKTGLNHALVRFPNCIGVVTADADGQHCPDDILRVAAGMRDHPDSLIMGVRAFGSAVPWKSRFGNNLTRVLMRLTVGQTLSDTQTGLRGIPSFLIPHLLRVSTSGYEFELDMLMACKHQGCPVVQISIRTIYVDDNRGSHFHPVLDSMRIYFLLLRFSALSFLTAALDNVVFALTYPFTGSIGESQIASRFVAMVFNYLGARRVVFQSQQKHAIVLPKYVLLVVCNGLLSYMLIQFLHFRIGVRTVPSKLLAEGLLFIANFAIQRDFVFTKPRRESANRATDWTAYYTSVPFTAKLTRRYSTAVLLEAINRYASPSGGKSLTIVEIGGANSCFLDAILSKIRCSAYHVVDTSRYGLSLFEGKRGNADLVHLHEQSVLELTLPVQVDLVFSVGLVEHFGPLETRRAVRAHFDLLRPGGIAIFTFPTPTLLYRATRSLIEALGMWKFTDERPLMPSEVLDAIAERGEVLQQKTMWPLILTQHVIVARSAAARG
jgi:glycosyltransferase involved in cell wall biosynthesis